MREDEQTRELGRASIPILSTKDRQKLGLIYQALVEKGYNPVRQVAHYLLSGEPAYITTHRGARSLITKLERDDVLEEMVGHYLRTVLSAEPGETWE